MKEMKGITEAGELVPLGPLLSSSLYLSCFFFYPIHPCYYLLWR